MSLQVSDGLSGLPHQKEGWESLPSPILPEAQCNYGKEYSPPVPDPQHPQYGIQSQGKVFHQTGCLVEYNNVRIKEGDEWKVVGQTKACSNL